MQIPAMFVEEGGGRLLSLATQDVIQPQQLPLSVSPLSANRTEYVMMRSVSFGHCVGNGVFFSAFTPTLTGISALEPFRYLASYGRGDSESG